MSIHLIQQNHVQVQVCKKKRALKLIIAKSKRYGDSSILVAECLIVREAIPTMIQKGIQKVIVQNDFQLVFNFINGKLIVPKDIINIVGDDDDFLSHFSDSKMEYCYKFINRDVDVLVKMAHL